MTAFRASRFGGLCAALTILVGCAVPQAALSPGSPAEQNGIGKAGHGSGDLIYAGIRHYIEVYSFPDGSYQETFTTKGFVNGMCSDSKGDVFVAAAPDEASKTGSGYVFEYAHGAKAPLATLNLPNRDVPFACSSDPATGNLAVTAQNSRNFAPSIAIYAKAQGTPTVYTSRFIGADPQAAYDESGDLFATSGGNVGVELLKGKHALTKITIATTLGGVTHVQWDGSDWALQSFLPTKHNGEKIFERIYRLQISGSSGKIAGLTRFDDWPEKDPGQSWIEDAQIVATPFSDIKFWAYPAGRKPTKIVHSSRSVKAITVSIGG